MKDHKAKGYLFAASAALCFSLFAVLGKLFMTRGATPSIVLFWQYPATMLGISAYFLVRKIPGFHVEKRKRPLYFLAALLAVGANLTFYHSMKYIGASLTTLLFYSYPVFTALFFSITGIRKISAFNWLAIGLALLGSSLTLEIFSGVGTIHPLGIGFGLLAGLFYCFYGVLLDLKLSNEIFHSINFFSCILGFFVINFLIFTGNENPFSLGLGETLGLIGIGLFSGLLPNYLNFKSITLIGTEKSSVVLSLELPSTLVLAYMLLGEKMKPFQLLGIVIVLSAIILLKMGDKKLEIKNEVAVDLEKGS